MTMNLTEKIVAMVFRAQGSMTLDELCSPGAEEKVAEKIAGELDGVLREWHLSISSVPCRE